MGKGGKKGKKEILSSADRIRLANQAKKQAKEDDKKILDDDNFDADACEWGGEGVGARSG